MSMRTIDKIPVFITDTLRKPIPGPGIKGTSNLVVVEERGAYRLGVFVRDCWWFLMLEKNWNTVSYLSLMEDPGQVHLFYATVVE